MADDNAAAGALSEDLAPMFLMLDSRLEKLHIVGILCSVWSDVFRRHHRSPALARKPAGQDPGRAFGTLRLAPGLHVNGQ